MIFGILKRDGRMGDRAGKEDNTMFLVLLKYVKSLDQVESYLDEHVRFLDKYYGQEKFIFSGRRNPRTNLNS